MKSLRVILSGGGTGGHIYPAVAVAEALKRRLGSNVEILFVGAEGKMEMERIPAMGYNIVGLPVAGLQRRLTARNLLLPFKVAASIRKARRVIGDFGADAVAGFGGYASAPVLWSAQKLGLPTLIQEQNSFAGITNRVLGRKAKWICVAYDGMERFFPASRIVLTGNPLRSGFGSLPDRKEALEYYGLSGKRPVLMVVGGSLGTRSLNNMMKQWVDRIIDEGKIEVIWQTGRIYIAEIESFMAAREHRNIWFGEFMERMDLAYAAADLVISRSGACTVSELCLAGKPTIFVPSPNVAEDHQRHNSMALVNRGAAMMCLDSEAVEKAIPMALGIMEDRAKLSELAKNIKRLAITDSAERVVEQILAMTDSK